MQEASLGCSSFHVFSVQLDEHEKQADAQKLDVKEYYQFLNANKQYTVDPTIHLRLVAVLKKMPESKQKWSIGRIFLRVILRRKEIRPKEYERIRKEIVEISSTVSDEEFFNSLPGDIKKYILEHLDLKSLGRTTQVSKSWKDLSIEEIVRKSNIDARFPSSKIELRTIDNIKVFVRTYGAHLRCLNLLEYPDLNDADLQEIITYCSNLIQLIIKSYEITKLPELPVRLQELACDCFQLSEVPKLPPNIRWLTIWRSSCISQLPELPPGMLMLSCAGSTNLTHLPKFPSTLQTLICRGCFNLIQLPELPLSLQKLDCFDCVNLTHVPELPLGLQIFRYEYCHKLIDKPRIPDGCKV